MPHGSMQNCIEACNDCAVSCDHCAAACLGENDVKMLARCIALDVDCAAVCRTAVGLMYRTLANGLVQEFGCRRLACDESRLPGLFQVEQHHDAEFGGEAGQRDESDAGGNRDLVPE